MLATKVEEIHNDRPRDLRSFRLFDILLSIFIVVLLVSQACGPEDLRLRPVPH